MLHDARGPFGAEHTLVHWMIAVALDIGHLAVLHVNIDPAAAGAHIARRFAYLVRNLR